MKTLKLNKKTTEDLEKLNTKNLLAYYKAERERFYSFTATNRCECCGDFYWDIDKKYDNDKLLYNDWDNYLENIKLILNKREHVQR